MKWRDEERKEEEGTGGERRRVVLGGMKITSYQTDRIGTDPVLIGRERGSEEEKKVDCLLTERSHFPSHLFNSPPFS